MNYKRIINNIPEFKGRKVSIEELRGGLTNRNFLIQSDSGRFVARFSPPKSSYLGMNKKFEFNHYRVAWKSQIGPKPVKFYPKLGLLIVQYIDGKVCDQKKIIKPQVIKKLAEVFKKLHTGPKFNDNIDLFKITRQYHSTAKRLGAWLPSETSKFLDILKQIEHELKDPNWAKPSHLDLMVENIIFSRGSIKLIDWEYSGNADCRFDLANLSFKAKFNDQQDKLMLKYYAKPGFTPRQLKLMKCVVALREAGWSWVQMKLSKINFDYKKYGMYHINAFEKQWRELN